MLLLRKRLPKNICLPFGRLLLHAISESICRKRNQLVLGIKRGDIRDRLLEKRELTLGKALEIAVSMELSRKGSTEIEGGSSRQELHAVHQPRRDKKGPNNAKQNATAPGTSCFRCRDKTHLANVCKHKHTVCSFCMLQGHLAKVWLKKAASTKTNTLKIRKTHAVHANYVINHQGTHNLQIRDICSERVIALSEILHRVSKLLQIKHKRVGYMRCVSDAG